jgi:two-component system, NtrC family, nitrogen regulation sensor histidine kinase NtrY
MRPALPAGLTLIIRRMSSIAAIFPVATCLRRGMESRVEPETLELAVDAGLLDQALINLVRNALEALRDTPSGHIALLAYREPDGRIAISVADNGPGIPADQREKVFVPFFTTKRQGSGIGLTLVRQIAAAHGAGVDVSQTPGGGATVRLRF